MSRAMQISYKSRALSKTRYKSKRKHSHLLICKANKLFFSPLCHHHILSLLDVYFYYHIFLTPAIVSATISVNSTVIFINPIVRNHTGIILSVVLYLSCSVSTSFHAFFPHLFCVIIFELCFCLLLQISKCQ